MYLYDLIVIGLASYLLSYYITQTEGLFNIFVKLRSLAGTQRDEIKDIDGNGTGEYIESANTPLAKLFTCPICFSFYAGCFCFTVYQFLPTVITLLAIVGISVYLSMR